MNYYKSKFSAKIGDKIVGGWCGDCRIVKKTKYETVARNVLTKEEFEVSDYIGSCDLLERKGLTY
jgi:hypothetical protein